MSPTRSYPLTVIDWVLPCRAARLGGHGRPNRRGCLPGAYPGKYRLLAKFKMCFIPLAHPTRFERVTFAFGGQRSATPARWQAAAALQQLVAKLSCKGVRIFYQDGRGKTFSTSLEVGRNKSWAETTCYKSDTCPFVPFGIECASQDRTNPWPTGVPLNGSKGALPSRPSPSPPQAQKPSNNQQSLR